MEIEKLDKDAECMRVPLARGTINDRAFVLSLMDMGEGIIIEFEDGAYFVKTDWILTEMVKEIYGEE